MVQLPDTYDALLVMRYLGHVDALLPRMKAWAVHCPRNFHHRLCLILAERARVCMLSHLACAEQLSSAMALYDSAVDIANLEGFPLDEGFAAERAASFYSSLGRSKIALMFRQRAFDAYTAAGAVMKLKQLIHRFPQDDCDLAAAMAAVHAASTIAGCGTASGHSHASMPQLPSSAIDASILIGLSSFAPNFSSLASSSSSSSSSSGIGKDQSFVSNSAMSKNAMHSAGAPSSALSSLPQTPEGMASVVGSTVATLRDLRRFSSAKRARTWPARTRR